jgi:hypothetical protein
MEPTSRRASRWASTWAVRSPALRLATDRLACPRCCLPRMGSIAPLAPTEAGASDSRDGGTLLFEMHDTAP